MSLLTAKNLTYSAGDSTLVLDADFTLEPGVLTALVGPNGAGKTTLLRLALGLLKPDAGFAKIGDKDTSNMRPIERARKLAYLPQMRPIAWPQPVRDIVALGRFAYGAGPARLSSEDQAAISRAITACELEGFEDRAADTLSGGELSRVHLARALAAETPVIIADEPVAALDPRHSHEVLRLFKRATGDGRAVLAVVHDLALAAQYADRIVWMKDAKIVAEGTPAKTMTTDRLEEVFEINASITKEANGRMSLDILGPA